MEPTYISPEMIAEMQWVSLRNRRDQLIAQTDWTQFPDTPLTKEKVGEFAAYRQALRDIPQQYDDPDSVIWPEKPTL